jgi:hypothetical protein
MQRWSGPIAARRRSPVEDALRARTIRTVMTEASTLRASDATERRRAQRVAHDHQRTAEAS